MPPNAAPTTSPAPSTISTITDPVTKLSFSRDTSVPGSNYQPVAPAPTAPAPAATPAAPASAPTNISSVQDQVAKNLGYDSYIDAVTKLTAAPTKSETQIYNDAYTAAGLDQLAAKIAGRQNDLAQASATIDDNPWLDEADRVGRQRTLTSLASADIKNYQDEYSTKLKSVEDLVKQESDDQNATTASNKTKLAALEAQAKAQATAAAASAKSASVAPKTIKGSSGATYKWNPTTQQFEQILPGKATSGSGGGKPTPDAISKITSVIQSIVSQGQANGQKDSFISPNDWSNALAEWTAAGYATPDFIKQFKGYANTKDPTNHYEGLN